MTPTSPDDRDLVAFEARLRGTPRGQAFLAWLERRALTTAEVPTMRAALRDLHARVDRTQSELLGLRSEPRPASSLSTAQAELSEVVRETETAAAEILEAAEQIQEHSESIRAGTIDCHALPDTLHRIAINIFMACTFQDITGQRVQKVVNALSFVHERLEGLSHVWNISEHAEEPLQIGVEPSLLNGPALNGQGLSQADIDCLLSTNDA